MSRLNVKLDFKPPPITQCSEESIRKQAGEREAVVLDGPCKQGSLLECYTVRALHLQVLGARVLPVSRTSRRAVVRCRYRGRLR